MNNRRFAMHVLQFWFIIQVLFQNANSQARSVVIGKKFLCVGANPQYVVNYTCKIHLINRWNQLYNMNIELQPNVTLYNMHVKLQTYYKFRIIYRPILIKLQSDFCELIKSKEVEIGIDSMDTNIDLGCPYRNRLFFKDWNVTYGSKIDLPNLMAGQWRIDAQLLTKRNGSGNLDTVITLQQFIELKQVRV